MTGNSGTQVWSKSLLESGILAIELFNRPSELGRAHGVLMFLQHSFEMLLKAGNLQETGTIHEKLERYTCAGR